MSADAAGALAYEELAESRGRFDAFVSRIAGAGRVAVLADGDADGLGAAAVLLEQFPHLPLLPMAVPKGMNAYTPPVRASVMAADPDALFVLDLGVREYEIAPARPTLAIDHHRPLGAAANTELISGYAWAPPPTTSLLTYLLCWREDAPAPYAWKAAIGNSADLGPEFAPFTAAAKRQKSKWMKEALSLVNTAKRSSDPDRAIPAALELLRRSGSAEELATSRSNEAELLRTLREEVRAELAEARRVGPKFSKTEPIALVRFDSPARVHPLLAQSWRGRLPKYVVMTANAGYLPGRVTFSLRTNSSVNLLDLLAEHGEKLGIDEPEYGLGHDKATGGSLPLATFRRLMESMGFELSEIGFAGT